MVAHFPSGVSRRLGPSGSRWLQLATHWGTYVRYLESLEMELGKVRLPGIGESELADSFVPVRLRPWPETADSTPPSESSRGLPRLSKVLEQHLHVQVVGPAGTGKSALLRWHAIESARAIREAGRLSLLAEGGPQPMPVYVALADPAPGESLEAQATATLTAHGFEPADEFLQAHLETGRAVLLFDGLDHLTSDERKEAATRISDLVSRYPDNRVVVATRDVADQAWLPEFTVMDVVGIDPAQIGTLCKRWGYEQLANTSGFFQVVERSAMVRSLVSRPGWLAAGLDGISDEPGATRAFDVVDGFVRHLETDVDTTWARAALTLHDRQSTVGRLNDLPIDRRSADILQWLSSESFRFVHPAAQAYFAALALADDVEGLTSRAGDDWWRPVIVLSVGHMPDPRPLIEGLVKRGLIQLAALVLAEARPVPPDLAECVQSKLLGVIGDGDTRNDRELAISLAALLSVESVHRTGVIAPVLLALSEGETSVRAAAAAALGRLADPSAIPALLTSLGDNEELVRKTASESLSTFGERTVQPLVRQLGVPNDTVRKAAVEALALQGDRAVHALIPLLDGSAAGGRTEAAEALSLIGPPAVPALLKELKNASSGANRADGMVEGVSDALTRIGTPAAVALVPVFAEAGPAERRQIVGILRAMGSDAVGALAEMVENPKHPHSATAATLVGDLPGAGASAATSLVAGLSDSRFEVRAEARRSLRRLGAEVADSLLGTLKHPDLHIQWEAAQILLSLPNPPAEELTATLTDMLEADDVAVRRRAVRALGMLTGNAVRDALERGMADSDPIVRRSAISQLGILGDPAAVGALEKQWEQEEDEEAELLILRTLVELSPEQSVDTLLEGLASDNREACSTAAELLAGVGVPAVVPLVEALNARPADLDLEGALFVLERAGSGARAGGRGPANLARTYHRLLVEALDVDELVYLATTIEWWPPAFELHRTFDIARHALGYDTLAGIASAEVELDWIDDIDNWLRPAAQKTLRQLRSISQAVQYYNRGSSRRTKEKGLLAAADRLNGLRAMTGQLGEPHTRVFHQVAEHWSHLINEAIRELQGRADLDVEIRTDHVRIRDVETAAVLVFELFNRGEGLASNVQLTLSVEDEALVLLSAPTYYFPPLGQGDRISAEFTVRRQGAGVVPITIDVKYDDPQTEGQTRRFPREVRFFVEDAEYQEIGSSPYIAGPPVKTPQMFYGRQNTFSWIQENLSGTYQDNVLVLHGERRTGKTSVLYQLPYHLPEDYAFVLVDLQSIAYGLRSTEELLHAMARKTVGGLIKRGFDLQRPKREQFAEHPLEEFELLGEVIGDMAIATNRRAVLIVDEFDLLIEAAERGDVSPYVFDTIRGLMQHQEGLSFIFAGAHKISAMLKDPKTILFNTALSHRVSFLVRDNAERLIREPVSDVLWFDDLAVEKILRVTAGQPYFIQYICHEIVNLARRDMRNFVTLRDVDRALQATVEETTGIIRHSYMSLEMQERASLTSVAQITDDGRPFASLDDIVETLAHDGVTTVKRDLFEALRTLVERDFLLERGGDGTDRQYGFAMELVRVWIEQNDEYARLVEELRE